MRIRYLKECMALAKYLNYSATAERVHITQPVLSRHISALENELGIKLFIRDKRSVRLTREGEYLLKDIGKIVDLYDLFLEKAAVIKKGFTGNLKIAIMFYAVKKHLSPVIAPFTDKYPNINLQLFPSYPKDIVEALLCNQVDIGILTNIYFSNSNRLLFHAISREPFVAAMNYDNKLVKRTHILLSELKDDVFVFIHDFYSDMLNEHIISLCRSHGFEPKEHILVDNIETALLTVQIKGGVIILPCHFKTVNVSNLAYVDISDEDCYLDLCIGYRSDNNNPAIPLFIKTCESVL